MESGHCYSNTTLEIVRLLSRICHFLTSRSWLVGLCTRNTSLDVPKMGVVILACISESGNSVTVGIDNLGNWMLQRVQRLHSSPTESRQVISPVVVDAGSLAATIKEGRSHNRCNVYSLKRFSFNLRYLCGLETSSQLLKTQTYEGQLFEAGGDGTSIRVTTSQNSWVEV
jgi:hypothetical protein